MAARTDHCVGKSWSGLECSIGNLIELIEINRVQSALSRLSRFAAFGKEFDGTSLVFLPILKQPRRRIDLDERDAFRNGKGDDRQWLKRFLHKVNPYGQRGMRPRFRFAE